MTNKKNSFSLSAFLNGISLTYLKPVNAWIYLVDKLFHIWIYTDNAEQLRVVIYDNTDTWKVQDTFVSTVPTTFKEAFALYKRFYPVQFEEEYDEEEEQLSRRHILNAYLFHLRCEKKHGDHVNV